MRFDALAACDALSRRLIDFTLDRAFLADPELQGAARALWGGRPEAGGLLSDLWVEGAFPAELSADCTGSLADRGELSVFVADQLDRTLAVPRSRPLYAHQAAAIAAARDPDCRGVVVSAPTGAGKTEAFLLPLLDTLDRVPRAGRAGVRALILYPLNALVNDQVARMESWLSGQSSISLFHFTGETPEDHKEAEAAGVPRSVGARAFRFRTRQQARGFEDGAGRRIAEGDGPTPDIVVTNYSMLEYMLCRPQDAVFFGEGRGASALDVIVLDEAHLYRGTLAAEITLLLRRVFRRMGRDPSEVLVLATSATLGDGRPETLTRFLSRLSSRPEWSVRAIVGRSARPELGARPPVAEVDVGALARVTGVPETLSEKGPLGALALREDAEGVRGLADTLALFLSEPVPEESHPASWLLGALPKMEVFHRLVDALWVESRQPVDRLGTQLFGDGGTAEERRRAVRLLLDLGAAARTSAESLPLLPHRLHVLGRSASGLAVCLSERCSGPNRWRYLGAVQPETGASRCEHCGCRTLPLRSCGECGTPVLHGLEIRSEARIVAPVPARAPVRPDVEDAESDSVSRLLAPDRDLPLAAIYVQPDDGEIADARTGTLLRLLEQECPGCGEEADWWPLSTPDSQATNVLAETLLSRTPPIRTGLRRALPGEGRRLLAFTDSRQGAARLGPRLAQQHRRNLARSLVARALAAGELGVDAQIAEYEDALARKPQAAERRRLNEALERLEARRDGMTVQELANRIFEDSDLGPVARQLSGWDERAEDDARSLTETTLGLSELQSRHAAQSREDFLVAIRAEIARPSSRHTSVERLGLVEVVYPGIADLEVPKGLLGQVPLVLRAALSANWGTLLVVLLDGARSDGFVTTGDDAADRSFAFGARALGTFAALDRHGPLVKSWRTAGGTASRRFLMVRRILQASGDPAGDDTVRQVLDSAWDQLAACRIAVLDSREVTIDEGLVRAWRVRLDQIRLREPARHWQSRTRGLVWANGLSGIAHGVNDLVEVTPEVLEGHVRVGRALAELRGGEPLYDQGIWAEEHTAQLSTREARRIQDLFKIGARNVLSATTTMELGVDIGGLQAVLMANVPPARANYIQRAGRAGRRADGSSLVVTHAQGRPFDREVFGRFGDYLSRALPAPAILLDRRQIARRHLHAWLLSTYFLREVRLVRAGAMTAFQSLGDFLGVRAPPKFETDSDRPTWAPDVGGTARDVAAWLRVLATGMSPQGPEITRDLVAISVGTGCELEALAVPGFIEATADALDEVVEALEVEVTKLASAWAAVPAAPDGKHWSRRRIRYVAGALRHQAVVFLRTTVIAALGDRQFLPRYGFPIGVHRLKVYDEAAADASEQRRPRESESITLERGALLAVREYAPGRTLMVGGRAVVSRGIQLQRGRQGDELGIVTTIFFCASGHMQYVVGHEVGRPVCEACRKSGDGDRLMDSATALEPEAGFSTAVSEPPRREFEIQDVWPVSLLTTPVRDAARREVVRGVFGDLSLGGELLAVSHGELDQGYAICTRCGYADSESSRRTSGQDALPEHFADHRELFSVLRCWNGREQHVLRHHRLAARETTDLFVLDGSALVAEIAGDSGRDRAARAARVLRSFGRALALAGARILEVDSREIGVFGVATGSGGAELRVVLYDAVPGGAGHVDALSGEGQREAWLEATEALLRGSLEHDLRCDTACLDCILTFDAQNDVAKGRLERREALAWLAGTRGRIAELPLVDLGSLARGTVWAELGRDGSGGPGVSRVVARLLRTALNERSPARDGAPESGWRALVDAAAAGLRSGAGEERASLEIARDIGRRHLGEQAPLSWVRPESIPGLDDGEQARLHAHVVQAAGDAEGEEAIMAALDRARAFLDLMPSVPQEDRLRLLGAIGRGYAAMLPIGRLAEAIEALQEAVGGWAGDAGASYPLCELLRIAGASGHTEVVDWADVAGTEWLARHETADPTGAGYVRAALGRAWLNCGEPERALAALDGGRSGVWADHTRAAARRARAGALRKLGDREAADAELRRLAAEGPELWAELARMDEALSAGDGPAAAAAARGVLRAEFGFEAKRLLVLLDPTGTEESRISDVRLLEDFAKWFRY